VLLCFIDPRVRKIWNEASSCPGIFSRTLRFYWVTLKLTNCLWVTVSKHPYPLKDTDISFHFQSLSVSFLILFLNDPCVLLFCFCLFYLHELVEDDLGEETIAQTSTAEQSSPLWTKWPVSMAPGHWPFCSQRTRLLCSTGLSYSLPTHIILNQFMQIKQTEAKKKDARIIEKEDKKGHWQRLKMKRNSLCLPQRVSALRLVFPRSRVWALWRMYMYMQSYRHTNTSFVSGPWCPPH